MFFRKKFKSLSEVQRVEETLDVIVDLIKDLPEKDFKNLMLAIKDIRSGYEKIRGVHTREERMDSDIEDAERILQKEVENDRN